MAYNLYELDKTNGDLIFIKNHRFQSLLDSTLEGLANAIADVFESAQEGYIGARVLGDELARDSKFSSYFERCYEFGELRKITQHNKTFLRSFIGLLNATDGNDLYLFFYSREFRKVSEIVDNSTPTFESLQEDMKYLFSTLRMKNEHAGIYFIELTSIDGVVFNRVYTEEFNRSGKKFKKFYGKMLRNR